MLPAQLRSSLCRYNCFRDGCVWEDTFRSAVFRGTGELVFASLEELSAEPAELDDMEALASGVVSSARLSELIRPDDAVTDENSGVLERPLSEIVS